MARIRDLTAEDGDSEILHRTEVDGGLFGSSGHLLARPLATYLAEGEAARYLLQNADSGVTITDSDFDGERTIAPDDGYQAVALLTDRRVCVVVGRAGGDEVVSVPLADVFEASVERTGLLSSQLVLETPAGRQYSFPCKGDLEAVVELLRDDGSAWAHAERLLEDADAATDRARRAIATGGLSDARGAIQQAEDHWAEALSVLGGVHEAAVAGLAERIGVRRDQVAGLRRELEATAGARAHAQAQRRWEARDYEGAATAYDQAVDAYRESRDHAGNQPSDDALQARITGAASERAVLQVAPVADAETAANRGAASDEPATAATAWEQAHERFRAALELEWGAEGRHFAVDRKAVQAAAADAADAAVDARLSAARRWLAAGDRVATDGDRDGADRPYARAAVHVDRAEELARAVLPARTDDVEACQAAIDGRVDGSIEPTADPDVPLPADAVDPIQTAVEDRATVGETSESDDAADTPHAGAGQATTGEADEEDVPQADCTADRRPDLGVDENGLPVGTAGAAGALAATTDVDGDGVRDGLTALSNTDLAALVADVCSRRGWSTTVFTASESTVYDVLGVDPDTDERLLCWTEPRPTSGTVDPRTIARIATTRDRIQAGERATLVTTGTVPEATRKRAASLGVTVVDVDGLGDLLVETGLVDRVIPDEG